MSAFGPGAARGAVLLLSVLLLSVLVVGCERGERPLEDSGDAVPAAEAGEADPTAGLQIDVTPEDSAIFDATMEWARQQRLDTLELGEIMAQVGRRFVGDPYIPKTLDPPGPERLIVNLRTFDCVTYVESMLAFGRVIRSGEDDFGAFTRELRRIRYRDGIGGSYPERLHYFSEWIESNDAKGIVHNVTPDIGGEPATGTVDFMSTHADLYRQLEDPANLEAVRQTEAALSAVPRSWIPQTRIAAAAPQIKDGDIIAATSTVQGLDIAHTGLALWVDGKLHLMHAPLVGTVVEISQLPLAERIQNIEGQDGIMVARPF